MSATPSAAAAPAPAPTGGAPASPATTGTLAFSLVVIMLTILLLLVAGLFLAATSSGTNKDLLEFYKSALSLLVGAFGAWIGAGAAYFFGRENLAESSRSTEEALRIQRDSMRGATGPARVSDLALTAINMEFMFRPEATKREVVAGFNQHLDYWWLPVLDRDAKGTLQDIVHARLIMDPTFRDEETLDQILSKVDTQPALQGSRALHGPAFFVRVALDDKVSAVAEALTKSGAVVGVVVDEKGKPTYCFTKQDLLNAAT